MRKIRLPLAVAGVALAVFMVTSLAGISAFQVAGEAVRIDPDDLGGVVTGPRGPEAGVWVIAETADTPTKLARMVVTDDRGRYLVPDLPKGNYNVWVRGYGLVDSVKVQSVPGRNLNLTAVPSPNPRAAAQYYPANYWYSLIQPPAKSEFPGTGAKGNGIGEGMKSQAEWINEMRCGACHQIGSKATREFPASLGKFDSSADAWNRRLKSGQMGSIMDGTMTRFGRERGLAMYADWTDRIAGGEVPEAPPRPQGIERNVVVTVWNWSDDKGFVHDTISTDKRNPTLNPNGLIYSISRFSAPEMNILDPVRHTATGVTVPIRDKDTPPANPQTVVQPSPYWGDEIIWSSSASLHNPMMDATGRIWLTHAIRNPDNQPAFCKQGSSHPSAQAFPLDNAARHLSLYDPKTKKFTLIDTCYGTHHLQFAEDANNTLWMSSGGSGGKQVLGWFNTKMFDQTGDAVRSQGWTPFIIDTNGNGKRDDYVEVDQPVDPKKDKRVQGGSYGVVPSPVDGSIWVAAPGMPGSIIRVVPGPDPTKTALAEIYEPPFNNPRSPVNAYAPRGVDIDRNGLVWTAFAGSGHLASFDRRKCKVTNGPTATGQHCPEGWTLYLTPGPKFKGVSDQAGTDMLYYNWVDQFDALGLGRNTPLVTGAYSDALMAYSGGKFVVMRVPYPMGFYHRGVDGRIDDPKAGWKGRGLWANYGSYNPWHYEGGKGDTSRAVHFQVRPDPLAK
jgi:hypothetical protein